MTIREYVKMLENESDELNGYSFPEDIMRIRKVMKDRGIEITIAEADSLWSSHSDEWCAGWLVLPDDDNELARLIIDTAKRIYSEVE